MLKAFILALAVLSASPAHAQDYSFPTVAGAVCDGSNTFSLDIVFVFNKLTSSGSAWVPGDLVDEVHEGVQAFYTELKDSPQIKCAQGAAINENAGKFIPFRCCGTGARPTIDKLTSGMVQVFSLGYSMTKDSVLKEVRGGFGTCKALQTCSEVIDIVLVVNDKVYEVGQTDNSKKLSEIPQGKIMLDFLFSCDSPLIENLSDTERKAMIEQMCQWLQIAEKKPGNTCPMKLTQGASGCRRRQLLGRDLGSRSLLATGSNTVQVEVTGVSEMQAGMAAAVVGGGDESKAELNESLATANPDLKFNGAEGLDTPGLKIYKPPSYTASQEVNTISGKGGSGRVREATKEFGNMDVYIEGVLFIVLFEILLLIGFPFWSCAWCCTPCNRCSCLPCCKPQDPDTWENKFMSEKEVCCGVLPRKPTALLIILITFIMIIVGANDAMTGASAFQDVFNSMETSLTEVSDVLDDAEKIMARIGKAGAAIKSNTGGSPGCGHLDGMDATADVFIEASKAELPKITEINELKDQIPQFKMLAGTVLTLLVVPPFLFSIAFIIALLNIYFYQNVQRAKGPQKTTKMCCFTIQDNLCDKVSCCCSCLSSAFIAPYIAIVMLLVVIFSILAIIFSDFCVEDPIAAIINQVDLGEMNYLVTCVGTPPAMLAKINSAGNMLIEGSKNIGGMGVLMKMEPLCPGDQVVNAISDEMTGVSLAFYDLLQLISCETVNKILVGVFHTLFCKHFVDGAYYLWQGYTFICANMLILWFTYRVESKFYNKKLRSVLPMKQVEEGRKEEEVELAPKATNQEPADEEGYEE